MTAKHPRSFRWALWLGIPVATLLLYWPIINGGLLMDDAEHITPPALRSFSGLVKIWTEIGATPHYYPLLNSVFWIEYHGWGAAPLGYHLANILQHAASACLVVLLVQKLKLSGGWLAGILFALHPVHVESVAWISEQKNTLSTLLALGAALAYLTYREDGRKSVYGLGFSLFFLALLTKTVVAVLPPALLVIAWWQRGRLDWRRDMVPLFPWLVLGACLGLVSAWFEKTYSHAQGEVFNLTLVERTLIAAKAVCFYARTLFWPSDLMFINPRWPIDRRDWTEYLPLAGLLGLAVGFLSLSRRMRGPLTVLLLFVGMLFPVLGFFDINWFNFSYVADHFQYLPSLAVIVPVAAGVEKILHGWTPHTFWRITFPVILALGLAFVTYPHVIVFRNARVLYEDNLARNPSCWLAHNNLGLILLKEPGGLNEALAHFEQAIELKPDHARARNNYGIALVRANRFSEAIEQYRHSITLQGQVAEAHFNLGNALRSAGRDSAESLEAFERALVLKPNYEDALLARAETLAEFPSHRPEAMRAYRTALAVAPRNAEVQHSFAYFLAQVPEDASEAIVHYREAIRLNPDDVEAYNNLSSLLVERPGGEPEAIALLTEAVRRSPNYQDARVNLAMLEARHERRAAALAALWAKTQTNPDDPEIWQALATLLAQMPAELPSAADCLRKAIRLRPEQSELYLKLADLLVRLPSGREEARENYRRALTLDPESAAARSGLLNLRTTP